ncbi:cyclic AMP-dependent transcription factor ATF-5-like [Cynara cardunculus var. scolymus]|uniref:DUF7086 domain-containing protein n=1 Tax=Cynara cardunculus var. scolymus TaxID=59895 RepID=A0A118K219_CYNCS|nr:cyclic AMP-dependent transcription factor ATF-5-like [Cynara cardunculus var. scolymus]KVI03690.1 hypothetical protein Ccrd_018007 [Cynara cardunculus var. scolymus]
MTSPPTQMFAVCDDEEESLMSTRTRSAREIDQNEYDTPLSPCSPLHHGEPNLELSLALCSSSMSSAEQPPPAPPSPPPPPENPPELLMFHPFYIPQPPSPPPPPEPQPEQPPPQQQQPEQPQPQPQPQPSQPRRPRRNPTHAPEPGKPLTIQPPFRWATNRRAQVHSLRYLLARGIDTISGEVQCKRCEQRYEIEYNLKEKFLQIAVYIAKNKKSFCDRAPPKLLNPTLPRCNFCHQENSVKPKIAEKKNSINWLFLLLGQMLGCCTLEHLKYFCKHTGNHRTGAKDRILYLTYLGLCKQVDPSGPFAVFT